MSETKALDDVLKPIIEKCREFWGGSAGDKMADEKEVFIRETVAEYAKVLNLTEVSVLVAIEGKRTYSAPNYYQRANFPLLENVTIFDNQAAVVAAMPSRKFRCPMCKGISSDPYVCDSGREMNKKEICDWKAYGLFKTMGKGLRVVIRETFLEKPVIHEIFMPIEMEQTSEVTSEAN